MSKHVVLLVAELDSPAGAGDRAIAASLDKFREAVLPSRRFGVTLARATYQDLCGFLEPSTTSEDFVPARPGRLGDALPILREPLTRDAAAAYITDDMLDVIVELPFDRVVAADGIWNLYLLLDTYIAAADVVDYHKAQVFPAGCRAPDPHSATGYVWLRVLVPVGDPAPE